MTESIKSVLLAGSTGRMGAHVVRELLKRPEVRLRVLNRRAVEPHPRIEVIQGSASDPAVADAAVAGMDAVVSTMNGGKDVLVDGQSALLDAAVRHGVKRFIPSDYSGDYFKLNPGENVFLELHKIFAEKLIASGVGHSFVLTGGFMEVVLAPHMGAFDFQNRKATLWGTGDEQLNLTAEADVAQVICAVLFDPDAHNKKVEFAGEISSYRKIAYDFEAITGQSMEIVSRGDPDTLRRLIAEKKANAKSPLEYVFLQYQLGSVTGQTTSTGPFWNERYPHIKPKSVREVLAGVLAKTAA